MLKKYVLSANVKLPHFANEEAPAQKAKGTVQSPTTRLRGSRTHVSCLESPCSPPYAAILLQMSSPKWHSGGLAHGGHKPRSICAMASASETSGFPNPLVCAAFNLGRYNRL